MKQIFNTILPSLIFYLIFLYGFKKNCVVAEAKNLLNSERVNQYTNTNSFINLLYNSNGRFTNDTSFNECLNDTRLYLDSLRKGHLWALTMADATGKIPSGILRGNRFDGGNYYQCLSIDQSLPDRHNNLMGKYCPMKMKLAEITVTPLNQSENFGDIMNEFFCIGIHTLEFLKNSHSPTEVIIGFCIPSRCAENHWEKILSDALQIDVQVYNTICRTVNDKPWTNMDTAGVFLVILLGGLMALGTFIDTLFKTKEKSMIVQLLGKFSITVNLPRLFSLHNSGQPLDHLHGLRTLSMFWIIMRHQHVMAGVATNTSNALDVKEWSIDLRSAWVYSMPFAVDTFFFLSGFLVTWNVLQKFYNKGIESFVRNLPSFYIKRYLRMVVPMCFTIVVFSGLLYRAFDGPFWPDVTFITGHCSNNWWTNALLIHNFIPWDSMCFAHTWYLAADFQMYLMSSLLLLLMLKYKKYAKIVVFALAVISSIGFFITSHVNKSTINLPFLPGRKVYMKPWIHLSVYFIGMTMAYAIFISKRKRDKLPKILLVSGWITCIIAMATIVITMTLLSRTGEYSEWHPIHISFSRPAWALSLAWIVFCCYFKMAGPIGYFLDMKFWTILSRLSFAIYLTHMPVIFLNACSNPGSNYVTEDRIIQSFFSTVCYSIICATILTLCTETPLMGIMQIIFSTKENAAAQVVQTKCQSSERNDQGIGKLSTLEDIIKF